jgi:hypothetical protein
MLFPTAVFYLFQLGFIAVISGTVYVLLRGEDTFIGKPGCHLLEDQATSWLIRIYCYLSPSAEVIIARCHKVCRINLEGLIGQQLVF